MDFKRIHSPAKYLIFALCFFVNPVYASISEAEIQSLDNDFQKVSNQLYTSLASNLSECRNRSKSLKQLNLQIDKLKIQNKSIIAVCLIKKNFSLIKNNIDSKEVFPIFQFLLDNNNIKLANTLYITAKNESDNSLVSSISFKYARYYVKRKKWKKVLRYVKGIYNDLSAEDANLARLFTGIALQKTKKHRIAVKLYSDIPKTSQYYPAARLNIATAYIRQDWWTDAHIKLNEILENKKFKTHNEMINRLYLVLGYSLLRKEFYRDSREAFRNIELDSMYFNKALLGIVLTATSQEDYISALNAINILTKKTSYDLSVDESHLLLPYIYEKLNQDLTASASYTKAQSYYQKRIKNLTKVKEGSTHKLTAKIILKNNNQVNIKNNIINFTNYFSVGFLENSSKLDDFEKYIGNIHDKKLTKRYQKLKEKHTKTLSKTVNVIFDKRLVYLNSYMNQSRFGLARLFDNSNK